MRFAFAHSLFTASQVQGQGDAKFSCTALLGKDHPQIAEIKAAITEAAKGKWGDAPTDVPGSTTGEKLPKYAVMLKSLAAGDRIALHDGDAKSEYQGYAGNLFVNASNKLRPLVVGPQREPLTAADGKPYSGAYGTMIVEFWAQDNQFGKRVNASLLGAQFVKDGERLSGGGVAAADDFEAIPQEAQTQAAASGAGAASLF